MSTAATIATATIYVFGALIAARLMYAHTAWDHALRHGRSELNGDDQATGGLFGFLAGAYWPAIVAYYLVLRPVWKLTGLMPSVGAARVADLRVREQRIAELEREAGIR